MLSVVVLNVTFLFTVMLNVIMLSVIILSFVMLSVVMLSVVVLNFVMLSVVSPRLMLDDPGENVKLGKVVVDKVAS
jgi:hypothetical protein